MSENGSTTRQPYRGYVIEADPVRLRDGGWVARVVFELHEEGSTHFQVVSGDPLVVHRDRAQAVRASLELGRTILDSRPEAPHVSGDRPA